MNLSPQTLTILTVLLWSTGPAFSKAINVPGNAIFYTFMVIATLFGFELLSLWNYKKIIIPKIAEIFSVKGLISSLAIGPYWLFMSLAVEHSSDAATPWAVQYSWPVFTTIFFNFFFLKETSQQSKESLKSWLGMLAGLIGIIILFFSNQSLDESNNLGALFAILAAISFGIFSAYSSQIEDNQQLSFLILSCFSGLFILVPWTFWEFTSAPSISLFTICCAFAYGALVDCLGSYFLMRAIRTTHQSKQKLSSITSIMLFLPFVSMLFLFATYREDKILETNFIFGLLLLLLGNILCKQKNDN